MGSIHNNYYFQAINPANLPAKPGIHFHLGQVGYKEFTEKYRSLNLDWLERKIVALPLALWSLTVKTIYHLCKAILIGIPKSIFDKGLYLKAQFFHVARDFEESYGRIMSIFHDKYGLYHIHKSQFHHNYYDVKISLKSGEMKKGIIPWTWKLDLKDFIEILEPEDATIPFPFYEYKKINYDYLTEYQFHCLFSIDDPYISDKFTALNHDQFKKIIKYFDKPEYFSKIPAHHINYIDFDTLEVKQFHSCFSLEDRNLQTKFVAISRENFKKIMKYFDELEYFSKIPTQHINSINYDTLSESQFGYLFRYHDPLLKEKFLRVEDFNFRKIVRFIKHPKYFSAIHPTQVQYLNMATLTKSQIDNLFSPLDTYGNHRFKTLSSQQVLEVFDKLNVEHLVWISNHMLLSSDMLFNRFRAKVESYRYENSSILTLLRATLSYIELQRLQQEQQRQRQKNFYDQFFQQFFGSSGGQQNWGYQNDQQQETQLKIAQQRKDDLELLGLEEDATEEQIKKAFRTKSLTAHPDRVQRAGKLEGESDKAFGDRIARADTKFREMSGAWDRLKASFS